MENYPHDLPPDEYMEDCAHDLPPDEYTDGAKECPLCGKELGPAGLMLKHLGLEPKDDPPAAT